MKKLTQKQENFCLAYIETGNASEAYRRAYNAGKMKPESVNKKAHELTQDVHITARVDELRQDARSKSVMTRQEALERLSRSARVTITDIAEFAERVVGEDENGEPVKQTVWRIKNSDELTPEAAAAIKSITATKFGPKLELHDPQAAIKQLAEMEGWNSATKHEHSGPGGQALMPSIIQLVAPDDDSEA
jgi:phage terminase small subunit